MSCTCKKPTGEPPGNCNDGPKRFALRAVVSGFVSVVLREIWDLLS